jgi:Organic solvent tolerance protein OstA
MKIHFNIETTSNKNYLKKYEVTSPLIDDNMNLNSFISFEKDFDNSYFFTSFEVFEDLTKNDSDSYEYIYPNYLFNKQIFPDTPGSVEFYTSGYQKKYDTNKYDAVIVNDIKYKSPQNISKTGSINNFTFNLKNLNTDGENSTNHSDNLKKKILTSFQIDTKHPMKKETDSYLNYLTPKASLKFSPTETKNIRDEENTINYLGLFNVDRFNDNQMIEGGESLTLGFDYKSKSKKNNKGLELSIGQVYRISENNDLPIATSLGQTRSDFIGNLNYDYSEKKKLITHSR